MSKRVCLKCEGTGIVKVWRTKNPIHGYDPKHCSECDGTGRANKTVGGITSAEHDAWANRLARSQGR